MHFILSKGFLLNFFKLLLAILFSVGLMAEKVEITSDSMKAENTKKEVHFIDNVKIKKLKNWLHGDRVIVYFDENNETKMYEALGSVTFEFKDDVNHYQGSADKVTHYPMKSQYILSGKAIIDDLINKRHVNGDEIILDMLTGNASVQGNQKIPVKFIFDMGDK